MSKRGQALKTQTAALPLKASEEKAYRSLLGERGVKVFRSHPDTARRLLKRGGGKKIDQALKVLIEAGPNAPAIVQWEEFYLKYFGLTVDLSKVKIPSAPAEFSRLVIVAQGIMLNAAMRACKTNFPTWQYIDDLDQSVTKNDRTAAGGAYAVWFRDRVEADEEMANKSANDLVAQQVRGITLLESILMELEYFARTGKHLDIQNVTLCNGSRSSGGSVPFCYWSGGKFCVSWYYTGNRNPRLRFRVAVS